MCPYKYNPLLAGKLDETKRNLNDLEDVNTAGTVDGYTLAWEESSGTWKPSAAGAGDMLKSVYVTGQGTVYNASRLEENTLGSVRDHNVAAAKITSGTIGLARIPAVDDARIPDLETLSYGAAFAEAQMPNLPTTKITSGTFGLVRIPSIDNVHLAGGITSDKIPALDGTAITYPLNADSVGTTQIEPGGVANSELAASGLDISKFTVGTAGVDRIPSLPTGRITTGTFGLARIPSIDDARIPDLETLSYGAAFADAQIPNLAASKITTGTFNVNRIDTLDNLKGTVTAAKVAVLDADKITTGTFGIARVPTMDDAHIPDLETLSYGAAFGTAQIPSIGAYKISSGSFNADRIPPLPTTRITTGTFDDARIPDIGVVAINYVIDGGGATIGTGIKGDLEVPFTCHVDRWTLLADQHGSIVVDVWRDAYASFPPTDADSMSGTTNMPAISGTVAAQGTDLSGWGTQGIASGDVLRYNCDSCTSIERVTLALKATKI